MQLIDRADAVKCNCMFVSEFTFLAQWWSGSQVLLYINKEDLPHIGKEHSLVVMNHKYDIDWLMAWVLSERFQMLGVSRLCSEKFITHSTHAWDMLVSQPNK